MSSSSSLLVAAFLYVSTGILQPVLVDSLRLNSCLGRRLLLLPTLANTTGMACCGILSKSSEWAHLRVLFRTSPKFRHTLLVTAFLDLVSGMLLTGGLTLTGGAIFVILYNSCPAWTALLSRCFLGRVLSIRQTIGVVLVCMGLIVNVLGSQSQLSANEDSAASTVVAGSLIVLLGCVLHSAFFVLSEISLHQNYCGQDTLEKSHHKETSQSRESGEAVVSPPMWSCCLGCIEATFMSIWVSAGVGLYGFRGGDGTGKAVSCSPQNFTNGFLTLLLVDAVHAGAFFLLLKRIGAIGSALMKGAQAVAVVAISAVFFCRAEEAQCLTPVKVGSIGLVLSGTMCYAVGSGTMVPKIEPAHKETELESILS